MTLESSFDVVGATTSANIGINLAKKYRPDLILMDINMPEKDGLQAIQEIEKLDLGIKIIALSGYDDADLIFRAMKIGAKGYVLKTMASAQLIYAMDEVAAGKIYLPTALTSRFSNTSNVLSNEAENSSRKLTHLSYCKRGRSLELQINNYKGIAGKLFISETTVKTHVNNIFKNYRLMTELKLFYTH
ncbi:MAG: response regulator [Candidatus Gastranaerophilaceae bacterium]